MRVLGIMLLFIAPLLFTLLMLFTMHTCGPETCGTELCSRMDAQWFLSGIGGFATIGGWIWAIILLIQSEKHQIEMDNHYLALEERDQKLTLALEHKNREIENLNLRNMRLRAGLPETTAEMQWRLHK